MGWVHTPPQHTPAGTRTTPVPVTAQTAKTEQQGHRPQPIMNTLMHPRRERAGTQRDSQKKHPETRT